jgi:GT2 family glycosyltransferase
MALIMKDLRIVIVTWNSEQSIEKCLSSLRDACQGLVWDAVLVDNASIDTSVERARRLVEAQGLPVRIVQNQKNRGFSRACNQALAPADAQYVLLLNPDTVCPALALFRLVMIAQACPHAGVFGPRLTFADGRVQPSVRRFPAFWDQLGILLKLPHLLPWLPMFKRYWAADLDVRREQNVDQVMGACFLIRQKMIEQIGGLDERFFIWFEEVDYCRRARAAGWDVRYVPVVNIVHHGGQSFAQVITGRKQKNFLESLVKYFEKWHAGWRARLISWFTPVARLLVWLTGRGGVEGADESTEHAGASREWMLWIFGILALESFSLAFIFWPVGRSLLCGLAGIVLLALTVGKPDLGLAVVLLELLIGSKGALLKIPAGWNFDQGTSLRMVFLGAFMLGWTINAAAYWRPRKNIWRAEIFQILKRRGAWIALALVCLWAFLRGAWLGNALLLKDANAWGFLILLVPVLDLASRAPRELLKHSSQALIAGLLWLPLKTLGLLYVFSHGIKSLSHPLYLWVRRTGVGEVTLVTGNLFRIFMQSQIYALAGFLGGAANLILADNSESRVPSSECRVSRTKSNNKMIWVLMCVSSISILISL